VFPKLTPAEALAGFVFICPCGPPFGKGTVAVQEIRMVRDANILTNQMPSVQAKPRKISAEEAAQFDLEDNLEEWLNDLLRGHYRRD
jgi:hypothetical protein